MKVEKKDDRIIIWTGTAFSRIEIRVRKWYRMWDCHIIFYRNDDEFGSHISYKQLGMDHEKEQAMVLGYEYARDFFNTIANAITGEEHEQV